MIVSEVARRLYFRPLFVHGGGHFPGIYIYTQLRASPHCQSYDGGIYFATSTSSQDGFIISILYTQISCFILSNVLRLM